jgi:hypothetical protein
VAYPICIVTVAFQFLLQEPVFQSSAGDAQALYRGQARQIIPIVRLAQLNHIGDPDSVASLLGYLRTNQSGFYGARSLRPHLSAQAKLVCVDGSGAVEKQIDLAICRRFKGQGMRWTRTGANRLLKLRLQELARAA